MCSGSAEPSIWLAHVLADQLLKFCGHAICYNTPTLNNSQNLNLDFLAASFWVQWTRAHGSAGKCLISGGNNDLCKLGEEYIQMLQYANLSFILYSILKLLTYHTFFYRLPSLSYQRSNRSGFFLAHPVYVCECTFICVCVCFSAVGNVQYSRAGEFPRYPQLWRDRVFGPSVHKILPSPSSSAEQSQRYARTLNIIWSLCLSLSEYYSLFVCLCVSVSLSLYIYIQGGPKKRDMFERW